VAPLSELAGGAVAGLWRLRVADAGRADNASGVLLRWGLALSRRACGGGGGGGADLCVVCAPDRQRRQIMAPPCSRLYPG
jgi:subtilisin-like proprotein convertase family protein